MDEYIRANTDFS
jgi:hypothetical protein